MLGPRWEEAPTVLGFDVRGGRDRRAGRHGIYGWPMRFNHMELTFARGTLTQDFREEIDAFYGSVLGWSATDAEVVGQNCHILLPDADQFILLAESDKPMSSPGFDHLGLLQDTSAEVDDLHEACKRYRDKDDRVQIQ